MSLVSVVRPLVKFKLMNHIARHCLFKAQNIQANVIISGEFKLKSFILVMSFYIIIKNKRKIKINK